MKDKSQEKIASSRGDTVADLHPVISQLLFEDDESESNREETTGEEEGKAGDSLIKKRAKEQLLDPAIYSILFGDDSLKEAGLLGSSRTPLDAGATLDNSEADKLEHTANKTLLRGDIGIRTDNIGPMVTDAEETEEVPAQSEPPPPAAAPTEQSIPGAFAVAPIWASLDSINTIAEAPEPMVAHAPSAPTSHVAGLVSAYEVSERNDEEIALARPMEQPRSPKSHKKEQERKLVPKLGALWILAITVVASITGTLLRKENGASATVSTIPTVVPSEAPSLAPPKPPTSTVDDLLVILPDYTLQSLQNPLSPQGQALEWLGNHQNITNLPLWRKEQLFALAVFYYSMEGPTWPKHLQRSWMQDTIDECNWFSNNQGFLDEEGFGSIDPFDDFGVNVSNWGDEYEFCNGTTGEVIDIFFEGLGLANKSAIIPPEIESLTSLQYLYIMGCEVGGRLDGFLPNQFFQMTSLIGVDFYGNGFSGTIPTEFAMMEPLSQISMTFNNLEGTLPTEFFSMTSLAMLELWENSLTGTIPKEMVGANLSDFVWLDLDSNHFTGTIPSEMGSITSMYFMWLSSNSLSGTIPTEIGSIAMLRLLSMGSNDLSGAIPSELGRIRHLGDLGLYDLALTGTVPLELSQLSMLYSLNLNGTVLSGTVPTDLCYLQQTGCSKLSGYYGFEANCSLLFDCTDTLCGCDCDCNINDEVFTVETTNHSNATLHK